MENLGFWRRFPVWYVARANLKHNGVWHIAASCLLLLSAPLLFGLRELDFRASAAPMEMYAALCGVLLLPPVFFPELNQEIRDAVSVRAVRPLFVSAVRLLYSAAAMCLLLAAFALYMRARRLRYGGLYAGTVSEAVFLGALGMFFCALPGNVVVSCMAPMLFYILNYMGGGRLGGTCFPWRQEGNRTQKFCCLRRAPS